MENTPVPLTQEQLVETLREMADLVEAGDSWEGSLSYEMPDVVACLCTKTESRLEKDPDPDCPDCKGNGMVLDEMPEATYAMVKAAYRVGNLMGQGGMRMIGELR